MVRVRRRPRYCHAPGSLTRQRWWGTCVGARSGEGVGTAVEAVHTKMSENGLCEKAPSMMSRARQLDVATVVGYLFGETSRKKVESTCVERVVKAASIQLSGRSFCLRKACTSRCTWVCFAARNQMSTVCTTSAVCTVAAGAAVGCQGATLTRAL